MLALLVMLFQRRLIYFPTRLAPDFAENLAAKRGFQAWRNARGEIIGWRVPSATAASGAILIVHGNGGCALDRGYFAKPIHEAAPVDVYVLEYPGFGARGSSPGKKSFLTAAEEAFFAIPSTGPVYVVSESLGTGVAAHLAQKFGDRVAGMLCFAPYDRLTSVGQSQMRIVPVGLLLWDRFEPAACLKDYPGPLQVVIAEADRVIPAKFGQKFFESCRGPKQIQVVPGAGHNEIAEQSPEWWKRAFTFWEQNRPRG